MVTVLSAAEAPPPVITMPPEPKVMKVDSASLYPTSISRLLKSTSMVSAAAVLEPPAEVVPEPVVPEESAPRFPQPAARNSSESSAAPRRRHFLSFIWRSPFLKLLTGSNDAAAGDFQIAVAAAKIVDKLLFLRRIAQHDAVLQLI